MQVEPPSPFELSTTLRIACAVAAASILFGFAMTPTTDRLRMISHAVLCAVMTSCAIYGLRTRRNRVLTALLLLSFLVSVILRLQLHDFP
jgi:hypothetical protein